MYYITRFADKRKPDHRTYTPPRFSRELMAFDQPTTYSLTVEQNKQFNEHNFNRRKNK